MCVINPFIQTIIMKFVIFAAVVAVSVSLFLLLPGKGGGTQAGKESLVERVVQDVPERSSAADERTVSRGNQGRRVLERKREKLLEDLRAASSPRIDAQRLLEILAEIKDTDMLLDEDVLNVYSSVVSAFSLDDLVTLTNMWPTKFQDMNMTTARAISQFS